MHSLAGIAVFLVQSSPPKPWIWAEAHPPSPPPRIHAGFGHRFVVLGDLDGDTIPDVAIAAPFDSSTMGEAGSIEVLSGADGHPISRFAGKAPGERLGLSLSGCADLDRDGFDDLIAGFAGDSFRLLSSKSGRALGDHLHRFAAASADLDGDGVPDLVTGTFASLGEDDVDPRTAVIAESGCDDHEIYRIYGGNARTASNDGATADGFGSSLCFLGDLDGDGAADFAASLPRLAECKARIPAIRFFSGRSGRELRTLRLDVQPRLPGPMVLTRVGDVDGDGMPDLWSSGVGSGSGLLISGRTGAVLRSLQSRWSGEITGPDMSYAAIGDLDGDGVPDLAVGRADSLSDESRGVEIVSGADGRSVRWLPSEGLDAVVNEGADFDRDGIPDLVIGLPENDEVLVLSGRELRSRPSEAPIPRSEWPVLLRFSRESVAR